jgi:SAM-dependent methyltransferase
MRNTLGRCIPSSRREKASRSLKVASSLLDRDAVDTAVEVGCGDGRNTFYRAATGMDVEAIEFSPEVLEIVERRRQEALYAGGSPRGGSGGPAARYTMEMTFTDTCRWRTVRAACHLGFLSCEG